MCTVHVLPTLPAPPFALATQRAAEIMGARCVVGFVPTGWTYEVRV